MSTEIFCKTGPVPHETCVPIDALKQIQLPLHHIPNTIPKAARIARKDALLSCSLSVKRQHSYPCEIEPTTVSDEWQACHIIVYRSNC